jgi:flagellar FliL protein
MSHSPAPQQPAAAPAGGSSMMTALKIGAFVVVVLSLECLVAFLLFPSAPAVEAKADDHFAEKPAAHADAHGDDHAHEADHGHAEAHDEHAAHTVEVDLEAYTVTAYQPLTNTTIRIDFHLYGTIPEEEAADFHHHFEAHKHRLREQVLLTARSSEVEDLTDAGLKLMKRRLLEKVNQALGKPVVKSVVISDFSFIEQ